uniref:nephrocystin-1-like isoform X3 n=1 Tax=Ciona intestinalis TaxID=7719 RepID=UPI0002B8EC92|nr:nephrocystin-1-like isoform X3 [Ciona intestinalis]|eukprot:XP_002127999.2 nephrocystin-1-like isoform X3 [Ciona intestinalis]
MSLARARASGPLGTLQKQADQLKSKIDEVTAITKKWSFKNAEEPQVITCHENCIQYKIEASTLLLQANNLQKHEEPEAVSNFEQKKMDEVKRLQNFQMRLDKIMETMEELENGDNLRATREKEIKEIKKDEAQEDNGDDNEEEDLSEEEYEDEEDTETEDLYEVLCDFQGVQDDDLSIKVGDIVDILSKRDDGWWEAENEEGKVGMVPSTFLKKYEEEEEKEVEVSAPVSEVASPEGIIQDPVIEESSEVNTPRTEFWLESNIWASEESGKQLWKGIKDQVTEPQKMDVTDVLSAMGALPAGFRPSMMYNLLIKSEDYSLRKAMLPTLSESQLGFENLHWDPATDQLRKLVTHVLRSCRLWKCKMIPLPSAGVEVLSRHVRIALFDGTNILSNIRTVRAQADETKPKMWNFPTTKTGAILPSLLDGHSIVRSNNKHSNIGILFELGITYIRTQTGERGEMSCGWVHLKLFDEQGNAIPNKAYELNLNGGTPFEQGVEVDPSIKKRAPSSRLRLLLAANKQPKLMVQIGTPSNAKRKYMELLPSNIILPSTFCEIVSYFRRVLVDALVRNRISTTDADLVDSPVIATFIEAAGSSDIMDAIRNLWSEKAKEFTRADKRDKDSLKDVFKSTVMETAYPLLHSNQLTKPKWADYQVESQRWQYINQTTQATKAPNGALNFFLSTSDNVEPFDNISELTYDISDHAQLIL